MYKDMKLVYFYEIFSTKPAVCSIKCWFPSINGQPQIANSQKENQKGFEKIILMEYNKKDFGNIKLTVGVKRGTKEKIQYCVTAIEND
jgi:hypothetical protein